MRPSVTTIRLMPIVSAAAKITPAIRSKLRISLPLRRLPTGEEPAGWGLIRRMSDRDDFLTWVETVLYEAELAIHNGDASPRRAIWSRNEPVSVLGAFR